MGCLTVGAHSTRQFQTRHKPHLSELGSQVCSQEEEFRDCTASSKQPSESSNTRGTPNINLNITVIKFITVFTIATSITRHSTGHQTTISTTNRSTHLRPLCYGDLQICIISTRVVWPLPCVYGYSCISCISRPETSPCTSFSN